MRCAIVPVTITAYTSDHQPGWVEGYGTDADGRCWAFHEVKQVYVSGPYLEAGGPYPVAGATDCRVVEDRNGVATVELLEITLVDSDDEVDHPRIRVPSTVLDYYAADVEPGVAPDPART